MAAMASMAACSSAAALSGSSSSALSGSFGSQAVARRAGLPATMAAAPRDVKVQVTARSADVRTGREKQVSTPPAFTCHTASDVSRMLRTAQVSGSPAQPQWWESIFHLSSDEARETETEQPVRAEAKVQREVKQLPGFAAVDRFFLEVTKSLLSATGEHPSSTCNTLRTSQARAKSMRTSIASEDWRAVRFNSTKAAKLRKELKGTETWQDGMYHSAIASRLAES